MYVSVYLIVDLVALNLEIQLSFSAEVILKQGWHYIDIFQIIIMILETQKISLNFNFSFRIICSYHFLSMEHRHINGNSYIILTLDNSYCFVSTPLALKTNQLMWKASRIRQSDKMIKRWFLTRYFLLQSLGSFTCLRIEQWVQDTFLLYIWRIWQTAESLFIKSPGLGLEPETSSCADEFLIHCTTHLPVGI